MSNAIYKESWSPIDPTPYSSREIFLDPTLMDVSLFPVQTFQHLTLATPRMRVLRRGLLGSPGVRRENRAFPKTFPVRQRLGSFRSIHCIFVNVRQRKIMEHKP